MFTLIVRIVLSEILYFCDRAYVTMTSFWSYATPSQNYRHKWNCVEFSWRQSVHSSSCSGAQTFRIGTQQMFY